VAFGTGRTCKTDVSFFDRSRRPVFNMVRLGRPTTLRCGDVEALHRVVGRPRTGDEIEIIGYEFRIATNDGRIHVVREYVTREIIKQSCTVEHGDLNSVAT